MKKIFIFSSSLRKGSNSEALALKIKEGAERSGNIVKFLSARDIDLKYCIGCLSCVKTGKCVLQDSMNSLYKEVAESDVLVFASLIYYYGISGLLKTFLDRLNPLFNSEYKFKEVYLAFSAAEDEGEETYKRAVTAISGWTDCFDGVEIKDVIFAGGVDSPNAVNSHEDVLDKALRVGESI